MAEGLSVEMTECFQEQEKHDRRNSMTIGMRTMTLAGVAMCADPVRLIAGGLPKGDNPLSVIPRLRFGVKKVYLIGCCANQLLDAWRETVPCEVCETLDRAVESARRDAVSGESVLLSPGAASFDQFKSYGERGDVFATLVRAGA